MQRKCANVVRLKRLLTGVRRDGRSADRAAAVGAERAHLPGDAHAPLLRRRARTARARPGTVHVHEHITDTILYSTYTLPRRTARASLSIHVYYIQYID